MPKNVVKRERRKIQFELNEATLHAIDQMVEDSGCVTKNEVIRNALRVYRWVLDQQLEGYKVFSSNPKGNGPLRELVDITDFIRTENAVNH